MQMPSVCQPKTCVFKQASVVHADPRLLMIAVDNGHHCGTYMVGHAPQHTTLPDVKRAWWSQLRQLIANALSQSTFHCFQFASWVLPLINAWDQAAFHEKG